MKLLMYGVNKETVMKEDTEKYFLDDEKKYIQMNDILKFNGVEEIAILADDFRNEYYLYVDESIFSHGEFLRYLSSNTNKSLQEIILETYSKFNEDVLRHLFEVASGYLAEPKGSFIELEAVEQSLDFAQATNTVDEILGKMFAKAIHLSFDLKLDEMVKPLNHSYLVRYLYLLKEQMNSLEKRDYLISGNDFELYYLTKLLLFTGARTISVIHENDEKALEQFEKLKQSLTEAELTKVYPVTKKSLYYRLAKADAAIINSAEINLFTDEICEEVAILRQTKKIQYLLDTNESQTTKLESSNLDIRYINGNTEPFYDDSEQAEAMIAFEEKLSNHIKQFMDFLEMFQADTKEKILK